MSENVPPRGQNSGGSGCHFKGESEDVFGNKSSIPRGPYRREDKMADFILTTPPGLASSRPAASSAADRRQTALGYRLSPWRRAVRAPKLAIAAAGATMVGNSK